VDKFYAYTTIYNFNKALAIERDADLPAKGAAMIDTGTDVGKLQDPAKKWNALAMANL
jgi:hypothetical protein